MSNKVNWGSIFAGAMIGLGITFIFSMIFRAIAFTAGAAAPLPPGEVMPPLLLTPLRAVSAIAAMGIAFAIAGAATVILGRFQFRSQAAFHALAAFLVAAVTIHFLVGGAFFVGFAGYPLRAAPNVNNAAAIAQIRVLFTTPFVAWTVVASCIIGLTMSVLSGLRAFYWLESNKVWGERSRQETLRQAS